MFDQQHIRKLWAQARAAYGALVESPRAPLILAAVAFGLSLPSLALGLQLDDRNYLRLLAAGRTPFALLQESPSAVAALKAEGAFAWWSGPNLSIHFVRPVSALTHWVEARLWPGAPWLMHLTNCIVYAALVWIAALTYRAIVGSTSRKVAVVASLMFCVDDSHAQSVGWIASRHVVLATLFAILALYCHVLWRRQGENVYLFASLASHALALCCSECGTTALAYLVAYAIVLEPGRLLTRIGTIAPHLAIGAIWLSSYAAVGGGVHDAGWFRDPLHAPFDLLVSGIADLPIWLISHLGGDSAGFTLIMPMWLARVLGLLFLVPLLMLLVVPLQWFVEARFFALGLVLACIPLLATIPQDRLLIGASFGGFGWIGCLMGGVKATDTKPIRGGAVALRLPHLIGAVLGFIPTLDTAAPLEHATQELVHAVPAESRETIAVNVPAEWLGVAAYSTRKDNRAPLHQLYAGFSKLSAKRVDARTLELSVEDGSWCERPLGRMYAALRSMPEPGETRVAGDIHATVVTVDSHGLPTRVRFVFPDALDAPGRTWLVWKDKKPERWKPPAVGARVDVPAASMMSLASI